MQLGFPRSKSSHLVGITGYTTPWQKEVRLAQAQAVESIVLFALDPVLPDALPCADACWSAAKRSNGLKLVPHRTLSFPLPGAIVLNWA
ncbi:MAG: hypothetical protein DMG57_26655 [Acidobacteria bacterium]|nr:MAG: hypothetical protein DMG57_26655 [Acidobacteriota bacterium]